jgi:hypothetical protein
MKIQTNIDTPIYDNLISIQSDELTSNNLRILIFCSSKNFKK